MTATPSLSTGTLCERRREPRPRDGDDDDDDDDGNDDDDDDAAVPFLTERVPPQRFTCVRRVSPRWAYHHASRFHFHCVLCIVHVPAAGRPPSQRGSQRPEPVDPARPSKNLKPQMPAHECPDPLWLKRRHMGLGTRSPVRFPLPLLRGMAMFAHLDPHGALT